MRISDWSSDVCSSDLPKADDLAVRSTLTQNNSPSINIDYRLEKTDKGWKIYDLNVEGLWLIQNYRNQFSDQISRNGIDGLRSEERRVGEECVSTCRSRWSTYHEKNTNRRQYNK